MVPFNSLLPSRFHIVQMSQMLLVSLFQNGVLSELE
jgi:hypothetical protein